MSMIRMCLRFTRYRPLLVLGWVLLVSQSQAQPPHADQEAIRAMAGEYKVQFNFSETTPLAPAYRPRQPYQEDATEFVTVVEDSGDRIVLQHVLVLEKDDPDAHDPAHATARIVKHWRQEWRYEPAWTWQYVGHNTWRHRALSDEERRGKWVQEVYQVDDSPRYASLGAWDHGPVGAAAPGSAWEGEFTWRPLPRRESLKRDDYHVLVTRNRHTLTPTGWVHEQDSIKLVLSESGEPQKALVRETGYNIYDRRGLGIATDLTTDFSPGYAYWNRSAPFWRDVRQAWTQRLSRPGIVKLARRVGDKPLFGHMFDYVGGLTDDAVYDAPAARAFIQRTLAAFEQTH